MEDCTNAIPLGGNIFGGKWSTPDVLGIFKSHDTDIIKVASPEVVSAEIKTDTNDLITAFGQACSYKLKLNHRVQRMITEWVGEKAREVEVQKIAST